MNFNPKNISRIAVIATSLALATSAFAATNTGTFSLSQPAMVNGTQLAAGAYKVKWEGSGDHVMVAITMGKKLVTTVPGHLMDLASPDSDNAVLVATGDGTRRISQFHFAGKAQAIAFIQQGAAGSGLGN